MKRHRQPDNRPGWRDPDMPVVRGYKFANGTIKEEIDSNYEQRYREHMMTASDNPKYRNDPTYNLRRRR